MTMDSGCVLICDICGKLELSGRRNTIHRLAGEAGWHFRRKDFPNHVDEPTAICPTCAPGEGLAEDH